MNTEKKANKFLIAGGSIFVAIAVVLGVWGVASAQPAVKEAGVSDYVYPKTETGAYEFPTFTWQTEGYEDLATWWDDLKAKRAEYAGKAEETISAYGSYLSEEQQNQLRDLENELVSATSFAEISELEAQFNEVVNAGETAKADAEALAAQQAATYTASSGSGSGAYYSNGSGLTASKGVNWYNGRKETYYNLNMNGVISNAQAMGINGNYWVRDDGVKMYGDYVIVASQDSKGTLVDTSVGQGIVLDYCQAGTVDIATTW